MQLWEFRQVIQWNLGSSWPGQKLLRSIHPTFLGFLSHPSLCLNSSGERLALHPYKIIASGQVDLKRKDAKSFGFKDILQPRIWKGLWHHSMCAVAAGTIFVVNDRSLGWSCRCRYTHTRICTHSFSFFWQYKNWHLWIVRANWLADIFQYKVKEEGVLFKLILFVASYMYISTLYIINFVVNVHSIALVVNFILIYQQFSMYNHGHPDY
jgi:hypothetical protein